MEPECYYRAQAGFELTTSASASQGLGRQAWATLPTLRAFSSANYKDMLGFTEWESPGWRKRVPLNSDLSVPLEAGVWVSLHARLSANKEERRFRGAGAPARLGSCRLCSSADVLYPPYQTVPWQLQGLLYMFPFEFSQKGDIIFIALIYLFIY